MITTKVDPKELKLHATEKKKTPEHINAVRTSRLSTDMLAENWDVLNRASQYYQSLADFRDRRRRSRKYHRGDQWFEKVVNDEGDTVTEEQLIMERGKVPLKQNIIRQLIRSLLGQYRTNKSKTMVISRTREDAKRSEMLTNTLQTGQKINVTGELDARNMEEFLISGMVIGKVGYSYWKEFNREDVFVQNINPNTVFFNSDVKDPRMLDLRMIGELKDAPLDDIVSTFAINEEEETLIRSWYTNVSSKNIVVNTEGLKASRMDSIDFYNSSDTNKARVIEIWELASDWRTYAHDYLDGSYQITDLSVENIKLINDDRIQAGLANGMELEQIPLIDAQRKLEQFWTVKFLTPYGQCLYQSETVYAHELHPYVMVLHPLIDGEVWGLVEDIIDQQRSINRMISLIDFIMGSAAKGVLLVPEEAIPEDMDIEDFADEWTKMNGVIKFKAKNTRHLPQQISANITNVGAQDMLQMQMKLIQDIAGVSGAIQGQQAKSGTPSSLYAQEAINSTVNTKDLFESFAWYKNQRDTKMLKVIQQFYKDKRYVAVSGNRYAKEAAYYDPDMVRNTDFELVVAEGVDSPVYRQIIDDNLLQLFQAQAIDLKMYLQNSSLPFADKLLEDISQREQQAAEGQQMEGGPVSPEMQAQVEAQTDPKAQKMIDKLFEQK